jgi:hypothetical protein
VRNGALPRIGVALWDYGGGAPVIHWHHMAKTVFVEVCQAIDDAGFKTPQAFVHHQEIRSAAIATTFIHPRDWRLGQDVLIVSAVAIR